MNKQIAQYEAQRATAQAALPLIQWLDLSMVEETSVEDKVIAELIEACEAAKNAKGKVHGGKRNALIEKAENAIVEATGKDRYEVRQALWAATDKYNKWSK